MRDAKQNTSQIEDAGRVDQSLGDRRDGDAGDVHGSAGHVDRERGAAAHFREFVGGSGRIHLGADVVSRFERDRAAAFGMVFRIDRAEAVLHGLRRALHGEFVFVRARAEPRRARAFPDFARSGRRRIAAERAGHLERHVSAGETRHGVRRLRNRRRGGADDWAMAGRLDYGQFFVEMDFLHQRAGRNHFAAADVGADFGPAVHETDEHQERIPNRLHRDRLDQPRAWAACRSFWTKGSATTGSHRDSYKFSSC